MTHFVVTFRFKSDESYQDRYESFVDKVNELAEGGVGEVWGETSSFLAFKAKGTASELCSSLYLLTKFDQTKDKMVVIDMDNRQKATKGEIEYPNTLTSCLGF